MRSEELSGLKIPVSSSAIKPATFRLVAQWIKPHGLQRAPWVSDRERRLEQPWPSSRWFEFLLTHEREKQKHSRARPEGQTISPRIGARYISNIPGSYRWEDCSIWICRKLSMKITSHPNYLAANLLGEPVYRRLRRYLPNDLPDVLFLIVIFSS
jgi:hypothetical protein